MSDCLTIFKEPKIHIVRQQKLCLKVNLDLDKDALKKLVGEIKDQLEHGPFVVIPSGIDAFTIDQDYVIEVQ